MDDDYISVSDAASITGLSVWGVRKKIERGQVPGVRAVRTGSRPLWLIPRAWAETYIRSNAGRKPKNAK